MVRRRMQIEAARNRDVGDGTLLGCHGLRYIHRPSGKIDRIGKQVVKIEEVLQASRSPVVGKWNSQARQ
jgi:hypothetical protein